MYGCFLLILFFVILMRIFCLGPVYMEFVFTLRGTQQQKKPTPLNWDFRNSGYAIACVADALNLLTDYTSGFDECVGRLQRRLLRNKTKNIRKTTNRYQNAIEYIAGKSFVLISFKTK